MFLRSRLHLLPRISILDVRQVPRSLQIILLPGGCLALGGAFSERVIPGTLPPLCIIGLDILTLELMNRGHIEALRGVLKPNCPPLSS